MASGRTHGAITRLAVLPCAAAGALATGTVDGAVLAAVGCALGLLVEPDLDVDTLTASEWRLLRHGWLWWLGLAWFVFWFPYARYIPHRHPLSHWPVLGTLGRVAYLWAGLSLLAAPFGAAVAFNGWLAQIPADVYLPLLGGLVVSDTLHWVADWKIFRWFREDWRRGILERWTGYE